MTVEELIKELKAIVRVHPEARDASIWYYNEHTISEIGFSKHHKPARLTFYE